MSVMKSDRPELLPVVMTLLEYSSPTLMLGVIVQLRAVRSSGAA